MKKRGMLLAGTVLLLAAIYIVGSGFLKCSSAYISDYAISADGTEMTISICVASSAGYVRDVAIHQQHGGKLYLDCYAAFGGINGSIGAKQQFTIPINEDTQQIAIYRNTNCYEEVLKKDNDGQWQRVS